MLWQTVCRQLRYAIVVITLFLVVVLLQGSTQYVSACKVLGIVCNLVTIMYLEQVCLYFVVFCFHSSLPINVGIYKYEQ